MGEWHTVRGAGVGENGALVELDVKVKTVMGTGPGQHKGQDTREVNGDSKESRRFTMNYGCPSPAPLTWNC